jgi:hypothetical protein
MINERIGTLKGNIFLLTATGSSGVFTGFPFHSVPEGKENREVIRI